MLELNSLNEAQREAVMYGEGHLLVLAGPGSGKTFTITQRIYFLIQERHILPEDILVVTFTKDAALSMQDRFTKQSKNQVYPVNFGTFHSIFYHILRESQSLHGYHLIAENGKRELMLSILRELYPSGAGGRNTPAPEDALTFLSAVSYAQNTGKHEDAEAKLPGEWRSFYKEAARRYESEKRRRRLLDFDDMVCRCGELLREDKRAREYWQGRFAHILMDEFQDINPVQYEVVKLLAGERSRLFAVGDDDQSIYGFRGSSPTCLKLFLEEFSAGQIDLTANYRSSSRIVEASLAVIAENRERFQKSLTSARGAGEEPSPVRLLPFSDAEAQYDYLAGKLGGLLAGGEEVLSLAVLFRTNADMQSFAAYLNGRGVPYHMREKVTSIYQHFIVQDIFAYLRLAAGEEERELILRILNSPLRYLNREAAGGRGSFSFQAMQAYYEDQKNLPYRRERLQAVERLKRDLDRIGKLPLYLGVQYIFKSVGYEEYLIERAGRREEKRQEWRKICEWVKGEAKQYESVKEWRLAAEDYEENLRQMGSQKEEPESGNKAQLMTVHASKGLEFDRVWIPDCNENVFPHGRSPDTEVCEEERRIFYVAMTRAKKSLELSFLTGTKEHPRLPSRFLNPLLKSYSAESSSISSSNSQLSRNSSNASATRSYSSSSSI